MGVLGLDGFETIRVRFDNGVCFLQLYRPEANNTINWRLVEECTQVVRFCEENAKVLVLEGLPEVFCWGADFQELDQPSGDRGGTHAKKLYDLWFSIAFGSFVSVAHVRGKVNAGGVGFVAACDVVIAEPEAVFSLSELLFGLMPACVLPFLIRRIGHAKSNVATLTTQPFTTEQAERWGLVDISAPDSANLLRRHLLRLHYLPKTGLARYKRYLRDLDNMLDVSRERAITANQEVFSDRENLQKIARYVETGQFPWEGE